VGGGVRGAPWARREPWGTGARHERMAPPRVVRLQPVVRGTWGHGDTPHDSEECPAQREPGLGFHALNRQPVLRYSEKSPFYSTMYVMYVCMYVCMLYVCSPMYVCMYVSQMSAVYASSVQHTYIHPHPHSLRTYNLHILCT
jgi:hypothetical protein